ncbi:MAG: hypothetical protein ACTFAK_00745 [Candidatus Electronema sp. VV]
MQNSNRSGIIWTWLTVLLMSFALGGCVPVKLVGDYDEHLDKGVSQLQKDMETFLVKLESSAEKSADKVESYDKNKNVYDDFRVAVSVLRVRADSVERGGFTVGMIDKLSKNLTRLEGMHREGLAKAEIKVIRDGLTAQFRAILTFELAKKRGEKLTPEGEKK